MFIVVYYHIQNPAKVPIALAAVDISHGLSDCAEGVGGVGGDVIEVSVALLLK